MSDVLAVGVVGDSTIGASYTKTLRAPEERQKEAAMVRIWWLTKPARIEGYHDATLVEWEAPC